MTPTIRQAIFVWMLVILALVRHAGASVANDATKRAPELPALADLSTSLANVVEVLDGDSVVLLIEGELRRFEILGADTPEWREQDAEPDLEAVVAKRFLTRLLENERVSVFEPAPGEVDQVGRRMGYVFRMPDGLSVDLELVRQGYGKVSTRAKDPFAPALRWYEARAKELDRGVWGRQTEPAADEPGGRDRIQPIAPMPVRSVTPSEEPRDEPRTEEPKSATRWVWVTKSGSKYHREGCQHLRKSKERMPRDRLDPGMTACRTCDPDS